MILQKDNYPNVNLLARITTNTKELNCILIFTTNWSTYDDIEYGINYLTMLYNELKQYILNTYGINAIVNYVQQGTYKEIFGSGFLIPPELADGVMSTSWLVAY